MMDISMFGAVPDNACSDQHPFETAAHWFSVRGGNGTLKFGNGEYLLGEQIAGVPPDPYLIGRSPLHFVDCANLSLVGGEDTRFKYSDCLKYGAFDHTTGGVLIYPCAVSCAANADVAWIGPCISLERCSRISVERLQLDGNMNGIRIGGRTEADGWQREHTGIVLRDSWDITLREVHVSKFCLDGMYIVASELNLFPHGDDMQIGMDHCSFSRNGRSGFSWTGGSGVSVQASTFEYNGTYLIRSAPGAGMDIEYHGLISDFSSAPIGNGSFATCVFRYNKGSGVIADLQTKNLDTDGDNIPDIFDVLLPYVPGGFNFTSCTFVGAEKGVALFPNSPGMRFTYCRIHGRTTRPFDARRTADLSDHTHFEQCVFDETYFDPEQNQLYSMSWSSPQEGSYHLFVAGVPAGGLTLRDCTLHTYCRLMPFIIWGAHAVQGQPNYHAKMLGCTYIYEGAHIPYNGCTLPSGEYTAYSGQFSNTEVDVLTLRYPSTYVWTLISTDIQIIQAWDNNFSPAEVFASFSNLSLDPQPASSFPLFGLCPQKYFDPAVGFVMCNDCSDGCALCAEIIPPPTDVPDCMVIKPKSGLASETAPYMPLDQRTAMLPNTNADGRPVQWTLFDALGRRVGDFTTEQERLAVMVRLSQGVYLLTKFDPTSGNTLGQSRVFKP